MKTTVHIISHSHWDREWYQSFETHRMKLIELVDNILDKAENDPEFGGFFLDGQVIAIDDYLEIRPEKRAQVEKCIREGKIQTGPWYILQDEFLTSGEACVRNLQVGMQEAEQYGAVGSGNSIILGNRERSPEFAFKKSSISREYPARITTRSSL